MDSKEDHKQDFVWIGKVAARTARELLPGKQNAHLREDCSQAVFTKLFGRLEDGKLVTGSGIIDFHRPSARGAGYIIKMVKNWVRHYYRKGSGQKRILEQLARQSTVLRCDSPNVTETRDLASAILQSLSSADRQLITLRHLQGFTLGDLSKIDGRAVSTLSVRLSQTVKKIKRRFD